MPTREIKYPPIVTATLESDDCDVRLRFAIPRSTLGDIQIVLDEQAALNLRTAIIAALDGQ